MSANFVLVHGAWHGGWCWNRVTPVLIRAGARVFTPTLTGLGERSHLRDPVPSLETHVQDVVGVIESEELDHVILVGHSYGGMVITQVADRLRNRIQHLVYMDAAVPQDGEDFASHIPGIDEAEAQRRRGAFRSLSPDGVWLPPFPAAMVGVTDPDDAAWIERRVTPHPLRTWLEPVRLENGGIAGIRKTYVMAADPPTHAMGYPKQAEIAQRGGDWTYRQVHCGHDIMVIEPDLTAELLLEAAGG